MEKQYCIKCKSNPIEIKKSNLCKKCYHQIYTQENINRYRGTGENKNIKHRSEMEFIKNYFKHNNWVYQPVMFRLNNDVYTPDFYDKEKNIFIEVSASKQVFDKNKEKYILLKQIFPLIKFEIRNIEGELIEKYMDKIEN